MQWFVQYQSLHLWNILVILLQMALLLERTSLKIQVYTLLYSVMVLLFSLQVSSVVQLLQHMVKTQVFLLLQRTIIQSLSCLQESLPLVSDYWLKLAVLLLQFQAQLLVVLQWSCLELLPLWEWKFWSSTKLILQKQRTWWSQHLSLLLVLVSQLVVLL